MFPTIVILSKVTFNWASASETLKHNPYILWTLVRVMSDIFSSVMVLITIQRPIIPHDFTTSSNYLFCFDGPNETKTTATRAKCIRPSTVSVVRPSISPSYLYLSIHLCLVYLLHTFSPTFFSLLPGSIQVIFKHDANLSLVSQIFDESVSQQGVRGWPMQVVLDQTTIDERQETLRPLKDRKRRTKEDSREKRSAWKTHVMFTMSPFENSNGILNVFN